MNIVHVVRLLLEEEDEGEVRLALLDLVSGERSVVFRQAGAAPLHASVHPHGRLVALDVADDGRRASGPVGRVRLLDLETGALTGAAWDEDPRWRTSRGVFSPDGAHLALEGYADGTPSADIYVWQIDPTVQPPRTALLAGVGNPDRRGCRRPRFTDAGGAVLYLRRPGIQDTWELSLLDPHRPGESAALLAGRAPSGKTLGLSSHARLRDGPGYAFCPRRRRVYGVGVAEDGKVCLRWITFDGREPRDCWRRHGTIEALAVTPDGAACLYAADGRIWRVDAADGEPTTFEHIPGGDSVSALFFDDDAAWWLVRGVAPALWRRGWAGGAAEVVLEGDVGLRTVRRVPAPPSAPVAVPAIVSPVPAPDPEAERLAALRAKAEALAADQLRAQAKLDDELRRSRPPAARTMTERLDTPAPDVMPERITPTPAQQGAPAAQAPVSPPRGRTSLDAPPSPAPDAAPSEPDRAAPPRQATPTPPAVAPRVELPPPSAEPAATSAEPTPPPPAGPTPPVEPTLVEPSVEVPPAEAPAVEVPPAEPPVEPPPMEPPPVEPAAVEPPNAAPTPAALTPPGDVSDAEPAEGPPPPSGALAIARLAALAQLAALAASGPTFVTWLPTAARWPTQGAAIALAALGAVGLVLDARWGWLLGIAAAIVGLALQGGALASALPASAVTVGILAASLVLLLQPRLRRRYRRRTPELPTEA